MKKTAVGLLLILGINGVHADIYKWVDADGNVHFGDSPHKGAEKLNLPEAQGFSSPNTPATNPHSNSEASSKTNKQGYRNVIITQPDNQATIRNNQGAIAVSVQLEPQLIAGDKLQLVFDGTALGEPQVNPLFQLNNVFRGSHTFLVQVINPNGEVVGASEPVTVYVQRPRVGMGAQNKAR